MPVANEKIAVESASLRAFFRVKGSSSGATPGSGPEALTSSLSDRHRHASPGRTIRGRAAGQTPAASELCYHPRARRCGRFHAMANITQQKKRIRTAADQRLENLRYTSTIKTLTKRLSAAVEEGDADTIATEHRSLVKLIDRAVSRGALHRNTAARKKSQAARLAATTSK